MPSGGAISRQGSLCSLTLSDVEGQLHGVNLDDLLRTAGSARRTADEVWRDIHGADGGTSRPRGQMTLEDFLSRPGGDAGGAHWAEQYNPPAPVPRQQRHNNVGRPLQRPLGWLPEDVR
uniref:Uncharacterized protein n=1 Tax=Aegilops tauschii TaxID=37682 RepID=N1QS70_AEGTA